MFVLFYFLENYIIFAALIVKKKNMKAIVSVTDNRAMFLMELLHSFSFVEVQVITDENALMLDKSKDILKEKMLKQGTATKISNSEIEISPFVISMTAKKTIAADYDYKADYRNHLQKKYV